MWASGHLTADALYRDEEAPDWEPIHGLALDAEIQGIVSATPPPLVLSRPSRLPEHHVHHPSNVATKSHGSGIVALGSVMCFVGVILIFTPIRVVGAILLFVGFFVAVSGRMMS
jgi:hypothetical protein